MNGGRAGEIAGISVKVAQLAEIGLAHGCLRLHLAAVNIHIHIVRLDIPLTV